MQLTRAADYAVRVMVHLATVSDGTRLSRESLAAAAEIPAQFSGKVLQALVRANLINSQRGSQGGFTLARSGDSITMLDVIEAIEGPICLNQCLACETACSRSWWCSAHRVWRDAQDALVNVLRSATLTQLAEEALAHRQVVTRLEERAVGGGSWI